jgi:hypothetical protein
MSIAYYYDEQVARLQVLLEEVTRARPGSPETRFVRSDTGMLDRLASRFHHVLYGRRGAGKSSLLRYVEAQHRRDGHLVAWVDQETFQGLSYPDVLVSTLEEVFLGFSRQLREHAPEASQRKFWQRRHPTPSDHELVAKHLDDAIAQLVTLKAAPSESEIEWTASVSRSVAADQSRQGSASLSRGPFKGTIGRKRTTSRSDTSGEGVVTRYKTTKVEHLERALPTYRDLMLGASRMIPDVFVILDDFYRLAREDQARIAGYFHRVVKDTNVWLKIGSIRYWTQLYAGGSPAVGMQAPHDIRELSLDRGLLDFHSSKRFLEEILAALTGEAGVERDRLFSDGARDRLVLASGGVPRDYIGLISESIAVAKNRGPSNKSGTERVIAEDVNEAAGRSVETKFSDLEVDAGPEAQALRELVVDITNHCRRTESACFLVDFRDENLVRQLNRLQNMRFIHSLDMNESLPDQQSSRFNVYLLDVSQLAAQRAWQVDFMGWQKREKRRVRKLVFRPGDARTGSTPTAEGSSASPRLTEQLSFDDASAVVSRIDPPVEPPP